MVNKEFSRKSGYHRPNALAHGYKTKLKRAVKYITEDGLKIEKAVSLAFGVSGRLWYVWQKQAREDEENGFSGTELLDVYHTLMAADSDSERRLARRARELALDENTPNTEMLKFLLERRHGYKKQTQQDVEIATKDDLNFNINIVDSKPQKDDD